MALLAKTNKTIETNGRSIPTPFSETVVSPDVFSDWYTKNPSKIKFKMIFKRPKTNCDCLFLKLKILIIANKALPINNENTNLWSKAYTITSSFFQILKTNISPAEIPATANKYKD